MEKLESVFIAERGYNYVDCLPDWYPFFYMMS